MASKTWEDVTIQHLCGDTYRLKVPNGYLYRVRECANHDGVLTHLSITFVPTTIPSEGVS